MKQEDKMYNRLVEQIKKSPPTLNNPKELTADIMNNIELLPQRRKRVKYKLYIASWLSAVAALFLICLLIGETFFSPGLQQEMSTISVHKISRLPEKKVVLTPDMTLEKKKELLYPLAKSKKEARENRKSMWNN